MSADSNRHGTFSSSSIWKLTTNGKRDMTEAEIEAQKVSNPKSKARTTTTPFGDAARKYIKQVGYELELGRAVGSEADFKQTSWGQLCEAYIHANDDIMSTIYSHCEDRLFHPVIPYWSGLPDWYVEAENKGTVVDGKAPFSLEMFCDKINALEAGMETYKDEFPNDYWQHISNSILLRANGILVTQFEAVIYVPYLSELEKIRQFANTEKEPSKTKVYAFVNWKEDGELPYLLEGGKYKNLNKFRFPINEDDVQFLTERVILAGSKINENQQA